jgi:hypothetical protein
MATVSQSVERLEKLLANAVDNFTPFASKALLRCEEAVKEIIQVYPPQPSRTRSGSFNTYVRGVGSYPKSMFVSDASQPGGYKLKKKKIGKIRYTSQQLDKRWSMYVTAKSGKVEGALTNGASYSGYVNGFETGNVHQVGFHKETGWISSDDAIEQAMPEIEAISKQAVDDFVKLFAM